MSWTKTLKHGPIVEFLSIVKSVMVPVRISVSFILLVFFIFDKTASLDIKHGTVRIQLKTLLKKLLISGTTRLGVSLHLESLFQKIFRLQLVKCRFRNEHWSFYSSCVEVFYSTWHRCCSMWDAGLEGNFCFTESFQTSKKYPIFEGMASRRTIQETRKHARWLWRKRYAKVMSFVYQDLHDKISINRE